MKTLKYAMVAVLVACTMVSMASADGFKGNPNLTKKAVNITFAKAMVNLGLVAEMHQQLNPEFLDDINIVQQTYTQTVVYLGVAYNITGTYAQWYWFFYGHIKPSGVNSIR